MSGLTIGSSVRVVNTSKLDLNGTNGFIESHDPVSGRYHILLSTGKIVALKPENIEQISTENSSLPTNIKNQFNKFLAVARSGRLQNLLQDALRDVLSDLDGALPAGVSRNAAIGGFAAIFVSLVVIYGFLRAFLVASVLMPVLVVGFPVYKQNGISAAMKSVVENFSINIQKHLEQVSGKVIDIKYAKVILALFAVFMVYILIPKFNRSSSVPQMNFNTKVTKNTKVSVDELISAYQKGFDDATAGREFINPYISFENKKSEVGEGNVDVDDILNSDDHVSDGGFKSSGNIGYGGSSLFGLDKLLPLLFVGKLVFDLGGGRNWNAQMAWTNFQNEPLWKKALVAFGIARLVM